MTQHGLTAAERTRRAVALTMHEAARPAPLPPVVDREPGREAGREARGRLIFDALREAAPALAAAAERVAEPPREPPRLRVTICGPRGAGKSVLAHLIRLALGHRGIAATGPEGLRSIALRDAVDDLVRRGLVVELVRAEPGQPEENRDG